MERENLVEVNTRLVAAVQKAATGALIHHVAGKLQIYNNLVWLANHATTGGEKMHKMRQIREVEKELRQFCSDQIQVFMENRTLV